MEDFTLRRSLYTIYLYVQQPLYIFAVGLRIPEFDTSIKYELEEDVLREIDPGQVVVRWEGYLIRILEQVLTLSKRSR